MCLPPLRDLSCGPRRLKILRGDGHDVVTAADLDLARAPDRTLLREAAVRNRLLLTRFRDFGRLVFVCGHSASILFLRVTPVTQDAVQEEMRRVLDAHCITPSRSSSRASIAFGALHSLNPALPLPLGVPAVLFLLPVYPLIDDAPHSPRPI
jgi:predicted nuclease of predicted toxin-antitoxin system